jgi:hypothetical protein
VGEIFHTILAASPDGVGVPGLPSGSGSGGALGAERLGDNAGQLPPADRAGVVGAAGVGGGQVADVLPLVASDSLPQAATKPSVILPRVANVNVLPFATRGTVKHKKQSGKRATRGKVDTMPVVEDVKASKGTWAFRLRWNSLPGRPVVYVRRVTDSIHTLIREDDYEAFKQQLISSYSEATVLASRNAG